MESPLTPITPRGARSRPLLASYRKFNTPNRINQAAQILYKSLHNTVESFGLPLPVLVTETLTFADSNAQISARLSPEGWGLVVCGRRLLVWQYRDKRQRGAPSTPTTAHPVTCYELTLPQTDLAHKAGLVCVYTTEGNQVPSCIGISPEGVVRYWHSIAHDGGYVEKTADLHGQECDSLINVNPIGCILATTTCTVVLVQSNITGGRHNIVTRTLQGSGGWLGGLGRRVSSLFFSAMPSSQSAETKLVGVVSLSESSEGEPRICVVAGLCAQFWHLGSPECMIGEIDLQRMLRDAFLHASMFPPGDPASLDVHVLDMQPWKEGLLLLTAAVNTVRSPQMRYALAHICTDEGATGQLLSLIPIQAAIVNNNRLGLDNNTSGPHLVATSTSAYLYDHSRITIVSCVVPNDKPDIIELNSNGEKILGAGLCYGLPLFFSKLHGVISIISNEKLQDLTMCDSPVASPRPTDAFDGHLSFYEIDPRTVVEANENAGQGSATELLKAAFLHHMRREFSASKTLLNGLFPPGEETSEIDSPLDRTVLAVATDLVNDIPASDPRWSQANISNCGTALGSSNSVQIGLQLQDKRRAFSLLLEFLQATRLWSRLGGATPSDSVPAPTVMLLRGLAEKLTAALALRSLQQQSQHQHAIDTTIQQVMSKSAEEEEEETINASAVLSPSDLFYKQVSRIERAVIHATHWCNEQSASGGAPPALSQLIAKVNNVIVTVLQEVLKYRHQYKDFFAITPPATKLNLDYVTWTSCSKAGNLQSALCTQQALSAKRALRAPIELRGELKSQATALAAIALEFAQERIDAFPVGNKKRDLIVKEFSQLRTQMIQPLVDDGDFEHATNLAEKFHDFDILVTICEQTNNREKLYHYMDKFENLGFHQCAFKWFMNRGRGGQAALLKAFPHHSAILSQWLTEQGAETQDEMDHILNDTDSEIDTTSNKISESGTVVPKDGTELLWLHELRADRWLQASNTLIQLSENETESVNRMTIQASLGKLCALAAEEEREGHKQVCENLIENANCRLLLAEHHNLPPQLLSAYGLEAENLRVLEAREIIDMFINSSGSGLSEYDYSRALALCERVNGIEREITMNDIMELRRRIWCSIVLTDSWNEFDVNSPMSTLENMMFFKVVNAVHLIYCNLDEYLVPLDNLLSSEELGELRTDKAFQYLMKVGYEHVYESRDEEMVSPEEIVE